MFSRQHVNPRKKKGDSWDWRLVGSGLTCINIRKTRTVLIIKSNMESEAARAATRETDLRHGARAASKLFLELDSKEICRLETFSPLC